MWLSLATEFELRWANEQADARRLEIIEVWLFHDLYLLPVLDTKQTYPYKFFWHVLPLYLFPL
jgi:hypothetical protein